MASKNYYQILGLTENADLTAIKKAYRKLAMKVHPDVNKSDDSTEKFKEIAQAYEVLKDSKLRAEYDELLKYGDSNSDAFGSSRGGQQSSQSFYRGGAEDDLSDFFNATFGHHTNSKSGQQGRSNYTEDSFSLKGQDTEIELPILLEETLSSIQKTIEFSIPSLQNGQVEQLRKTLKVTIPMGVLDNDRIRLKGQGGPGYGQGPNGDLYLHIRLVPHPLFDVEAHNLILSIPILPWEALLGAEVTVPSLDGKIKINIKPNSQTGQKLRLKGKGLKSKSVTGDMIGILKIIVPSINSEEDKELWQKLAQSNTFDPRKNWND